MSDPAQPPTEGAEGAEGTAPGGGPPGPPPNTTSNRRLQQTQAQVEEVVDIMRVNVDKVLKRDEILSELDDRADALQMGASQFESSAAKLKRKYWWKNCKMMIMLGAICAIIVVVIARGHRWRRTTTVLDVPQAWSKFVLLAHPPVSQGLLPWVSVLPNIVGSPDIVGCVLLEISALLLPFSSHGVYTLFCVFAVPFPSYHPCAWATMQPNPGTLQANEAELPTSPSVCHETCGVSAVCPSSPLCLFFLTSISYLYRIIIVSHQRHVAYLPISCILNKGAKNINS
ncbi:vesicle-associated membrane protein 1 isoform X1 [Pipistrellus kuhlii]|uniref:vesicle-associated membrane protein 1 isoform X1 n=2 Tax=Pipistrellus kuhlii TaxID=59472 RepID=UPI00174F0644|nr:vesicle-associated membrane protein 1 isoform X1 [Pipistrellus kuhlii]